MALQSIGYAGDIDESAWAKILPLLGGREYGVISEADWKVTVGAGDREVRIAPGNGFGPGILDRSTEESSLTLPAAASGSQWHLIAVRRDWGSNSSAFGYIPGSTTTAQIPARNATPGTADDQPLALARVQAGQSQVAEIIDLRVWRDLAASELVLQYMNALGTTIRVGAVTWTRGLNALSSPTWTAQYAAAQFQAAGIGVNGIVVPGSSGSGSLIVKTGILTDSGSLQFGNQYLVPVLFDTAFPNALLSVQVTQIQQDGAYASRTVAIDGAHKGGFRAMFPGETSATKRSILWVAYGY